MLVVISMRVAKPVPLSAVNDLSNRKRVDARVHTRSRIVLQAADGMSDKDIAQELDTDRRVIARWRARFLAAGLNGLLQYDTHPGRPRTAREATDVQEVVRVTRNEPPQERLTWAPALLSWPASRAPVGLNSVGSSPSNFPTIRASSKSSKTLLACTSTLPSTR